MFAGCMNLQEINICVGRSLRLTHSALDWCRKSPNFVFFMS